MFDSGLMFMIGKVDVDGVCCYLEKIVMNVNLLLEGEIYDVQWIVELQWQLQNMLYYVSVVIDVGDDMLKFECMFVYVKVSEFLYNNICGGVGFVIDMGLYV